jgi:capsular exopolysaccharide synthesis family protein
MTGDIQTPIISVSSSMPSEGKTFCAYNLASVFSITGKKTVLIGFDMRKPGLDKLLGTKKTDGLSQYLIGRLSIDEIIVPLSQENLFYIPSGVVPPNPSELIGLPKTAELFETLKKDFDVIILDTPPMGIVSDGYLLARHVDTIVFLTRQNYTIKEEFNNVIKQIQDEGLENIGILVNDIQVRKNILGYGYRYGYGYGYGNKYGYGKYGYGYYEE